MFWLAVALITVCAILWDVGIVLQKLAVGSLPPIGLNRNLSATLLGMLRSKWWMGGLVASAAGWGLFTFALTFTPVSIARSIQGSGFVILAVFSRLFLNHRLKWLEWLGVGLITIGILALGLGGEGASSGGGRISLRLAAAVVACLVVSVAALALRDGPRRTRGPRRAAAAAPTSGSGNSRLLPGFIALPPVVSFSIVAGILLGLGDVSTKLLIDQLQRYPTVVHVGVSGLALLVFYVTGFVVLSSAYQQGRAILVTAFSDLFSRLVAIVLGIAALGEALPALRTHRALDIAGFLFILVGALFLSRFSGEEVAAQLSSEAAGG